jgi:signal transduction histidine kinase
MPDTGDGSFRFVARALAHDFNNLISAILGHAAYLRAVSAPGSDAAETAATIEIAAQRASELATRLNQLGGEPPALDEAVSLHAAIHEVAELLRPTLEPGVRLSLRLEASRDSIVGNASQIHQILMNLALNARDAMGEAGGELRVTTETAGPDILLIVRDTGTGVAEELREQIFAPFFTTKTDGGGRGLGLAIARHIVECHGGTIEVAAASPNGAEFRVRLPLRD